MLTLPTILNCHVKLSYSWKMNFPGWWGGGVVGWMGLLETWRIRLSSASTECCYICTRGSCPKRPLSRGKKVQRTIFQGNIGLRRLFSKETFTGEKIAQIDFSKFSMDITITIVPPFKTWILIPKLQPMKQIKPIDQKLYQQIKI